MKSEIGVRICVFIANVARRRCCRTTYKKKGWEGESSQKKKKKLKNRRQKLYTDLAFGAGIIGRHAPSKRRISTIRIEIEEKENVHANSLVIACRRKHHGGWTPTDTIHNAFMTLEHFQ